MKQYSQSKKITVFIICYIYNYRYKLLQSGAINFEIVIKSYLIWNAMQIKILKNV